MEMLSEELEFRVVAEPRFPDDDFDEGDD